MTTSDITGTITNGVTLTTAVYGNPVTIDAGASISANSDEGVGIAANTSWDITNNGSVSGSQYGIYLQAGGAVTNSGFIGGGDRGIILGGVGTVGNAGTVVGMSSAGIALTAGGTVTNQGTASQITGYTQGVYVGPGGAGTVTNDGTIASLGNSNDAIGIYFKDGGSVTNTGAATISGVDGVRIRGGAGTVSNYGTIDAIGSAIDLNKGGVISNLGTAALIFGETSIESTSGTIVNQGTMKSSGYAAYLGAGGAVTNAAGAEILGNLRGVAVAGAATVTNAGIIFGGQAGVSFLDFNGTFDNTLINSGTITGSNGPAIQFGAGDDLLEIQPGAVFNGSVDGGGGTNTLELAGTDPGSLAGLGASFTNFGIVNIDVGSDWTLSGANTIAAGVTLTDSGMLTNAGALEIDGSFVIDADTIVNTGTVTALAGNGIFLSAGGSVTNQGTDALITGYAEGVYVGMGGAGIVTNDGTIASIGTSGANAGVYLNAGGSVTNTGPQATISGVFGVIVRGAGGTVSNYGTISGVIEGAVLDDGGAISNLGTAALISGEVAIEGGIGTVFNEGTIQSNMYGVKLTDGGSITNAAGALIEGDLLGVQAYGAMTVTNAGTISSPQTGVTFSDANGTFANTLINSGTIVGNAGTAVQFGAGDDLLELQPGAAFTGIVDGGAGANTLELGGTDAGSVGGLGASFINFGIVNIDAGADWTVTGVNDLTGITLTANGTLTNTGTIDGNGMIVFASGSIVNQGTMTNASGTGVILEAGGSIDNQGVDAQISAYSTGVYAGPAAAGTVTNDGTIASITGNSYNTSAIGVRFKGGGSITNTGSASEISGLTGISIGGGAGTVSNAGTIAGVHFAVRFDDGGTVSNSGTIEAQTGIYSTLGGSVTNTAGGLISANYTAMAFYRAAATVTNSGTIDGGTDGIVFGAGGTFANTVINSGTIVGNSGTAVQFGGGDDLLELKAGAAFTGGVDGAGGTNTLELGGADAGSFTGLGTAFTNFQIVDIDAGADWTFAGGNTVGAGGTLTDSGALTNAGTLTGTVTLSGSGLLTNQAGALIGASGLDAAVVGDGTVVNAGTIAGADGTAVQFGVGDDLLKLQAGAAFTGIVDGGAGNNILAFGGADAGSFTGLGTSFTNFGIVTVDAGADWTFSGSNTLAAGAALTDNGTLTNAGTLDVGGAPIFDRATLINAGTITDATGNGIILDAGGDVINQGTASRIAGYGRGIYSNAINGTVTNDGTIVGTGNNPSVFGIYLKVGGSVTNTGPQASISGSYGGVDIGFVGGTVRNSGTIAGGDRGVWIQTGGAISNLGTASLISGTTDIEGGAGTIVNQGTMEGRAGIYLHAGGSVTNAAGAYIAGYYFGVGVKGGTTVTNAGKIRGIFTGIDFFDAANSTVINSGTIASYGGAAVQFGAGNDLLELKAGSVFTSVVDGAAGNNTLELAGAAAGTLTGLGTSFTNFGTVTVDAGAAWTLTGANTIATGVTLTDKGVLTNAGTIAGTVTLAGAAALTNRAGAKIGAAGNAAAVVGTGTIINAGTIAGGAGTAVQFGAGNDVLELQAGAAFVGKVDGGAGKNTLKLVGAAPGTITGLGTSFTNFGTIGVDAGAAWTLTGTNKTAAGATLTDNGTLTNTGTFTNAGTLNVNGAFVDSRALINAGSISGLVTVAGSGTVTNQAGARISGDDLYAVKGTGTVANAGTIVGAAFSAIFLNGGGSVSNASGGRITGGALGIYAGGVSATVENAGTITGGTDAVNLNASGANRLIVDGGAVFNGSVVATAGATNALELSSGAKAGTLSGVGTQFQNFQTVTVDAGASWTLTGANTIATLVDGGTLTNKGTVTGGTTRIVSGGVEIVAKGGAASNVTVSTGAMLTVQSGGTASNTVLNGGTEIVSAGGKIGGAVTFGSNARLSVATTPTSKTLTLSGFKATDSLDLAGFGFKAANKLSFVENAAKTSGVLTISSGALHASVTLLGQYVAGGFHLAGDGAAGTAITYSTSAATQPELAVHHG